MCHYYGPSTVLQNDSFLHVDVIKGRSLLARTLLKVFLAKISKYRRNWA